MCTREETPETTQITEILKGSNKKPQLMSNRPQVIQLPSLIATDSPPKPTFRKHVKAVKKVRPTKNVVAYAAPCAPMKRPPKPANRAETRGKKGINKYILRL